MNPSSNAGLSGWISRQQQEYQRKLAAWLRATPAQGYSTEQVRIDAYGSYIVWGEYGQTTSFGWEIDHELPKSQFPGIASQPTNLRALHWRNNRTKADKIDLNSLRRLLGGA